MTYLQVMGGRLGGKLIIASLLCAACGRQQAPSAAALADSISWRSGDLIFRTGISMESRLVLNADKSGFSHVGILVHTQGGWRVVHATTGEADNNIDMVKIEPVAHFVNQQRCVRFKVVRLSCSDAVAEKAVRFAIQQIGRPFDDDFSLADTTKYYCTELVWQAYRHQGIDLSQGHRHHISLLGIRKTCLLPQDVIPTTLREQKKAQPQ